MPTQLPNTGLRAFDDLDDIKLKFQDYYNITSGILNSNLSIIDNAFGNQLGALSTNSKTLVGSINENYSSIVSLNNKNTELEKGTVIQGIGKLGITDSQLSDVDFASNMFNIVNKMREKSILIDYVYNGNFARLNNSIKLELRKHGLLTNIAGFSLEFTKQSNMTQPNKLVIQCNNNDMVFIVRIEDVVTTSAIAFQNQAELTFQNGWSGYTGATVILKNGNMVTFPDMRIAGGTTDAGTTLCVLPVGFRPTINIDMRCIIQSTNKTTFVRVYTNGNVNILYADVPTGDKLQLAGSFLAK